MRRLRFRVGSLMILVALVAIALEGSLCLARSARFRRQARYHAFWETLYKGEIRCCFDLGTPEECLAKASYHALLREKYRFAAAHPWLSLAGDPAEPN